MHHVPSFASPFIVGTGVSSTSFADVCQSRRTIARRRRKRIILVCTSASSEEELTSDLRQHLLSREDDDGRPDQILSYASLAEAGRPDLVERIIAAGGYLAALERLGIEIPPTPPPKPAPKAVFTSEQIESRLTFGSGLENRIVSSPTDLSSDSTPKYITRPVNTVVDDVPSAEALVAEGKEIESATISPLPPTPEGELFVLDGRMRIGAIALVILAAVAYGRASHELISDDALVALHGAANALVVLHFGSAAAAAWYCASSLRRAPVLWFFKALLSGPAALVELERLGALPEIKES